MAPPRPHHSLARCVLHAAVLWARSYSYSDTLGYAVDVPPGQVRVYRLTTAGGNLYLGRGLESLQEIEPGILLRVSSPNGLEKTTGLLSFKYRRYGLGQWVRVPLLFLVLPPLLPPALVLAIRHRRRFVIARRQAAGQCLSCGYDLRASSERCPECGIVKAT